MNCYYDKIYTVWEDCIAKQSNGSNISIFDRISNPSSSSEEWDCFSNETIFCTSRDVISLFVQQSLVLNAIDYTVQWRISPVKLSSAFIQHRLLFISATHQWCVCEHHQVCSVSLDIFKMCFIGKW